MQCDVIVCFASILCALLRFGRTSSALLLLLLLFRLRVHYATIVSTSVEAQTIRRLFCTLSLRVLRLRVDARNNPSIASTHDSTRLEKRREEKKGKWQRKSGAAPLTECLSSGSLRTAQEKRRQKRRLQKRGGKEEKSRRHFVRLLPPKFESLAEIRVSPVVEPRNRRAPNGGRSARIFER